MAKFLEVGGLRAFCGPSEAEAPKQYPSITPPLPEGPEVRKRTPRTPQKEPQAPPPFSHRPPKKKTEVRRLKAFTATPKRRWDARSRSLSKKPFVAVTQTHRSQGWVPTRKKKAAKPKKTKRNGGSPQKTKHEEMASWKRRGIPNSSFSFPKNCALTLLLRSGRRKKAIQR